MTEQQKKHIRANLEIVLAALDGDCCAYMLTLGTMGPFLRLELSFGEVVAARRIRKTNLPQLPRVPGAPRKPKSKIRVTLRKL